MNDSPNTPTRQVDREDFTVAERERLIVVLGGGETIQRAVNVITGHSIPTMREIVQGGYLPAIMQQLGLDPEMLEREFAPKAKG